AFPSSRRDTSRRWTAPPAWTRASSRPCGRRGPPGSRSGAGDSDTPLSRLFRSVLGRSPHVVEYQVRQTLRGADLLLRVHQPVEVEQFARTLEAELRRVGCVRPVVTVRTVAHIPRIGVGKLRRFVALHHPNPSIST